MLTKELIANIRQIEIRTRRIVDELTAGAYHSVFKGRGMEFDEVREYFPGDDVRDIDWNVTARFGRPFVKKFAEERELTVLLAVDVSASGDFGSADRSKNEQAAELAALLAFSAIRNGDRVGLLLFSSETELFVPPRKGRRHVLRLVRELLAHQREHRGTDIEGALRTLMQLTPRRAIVFLVSDMLDEGFESALAVASRKHDLVGLRLVDRRELSLPPTGYLNLEDAESGESLIFRGRSEKVRRQYALEAAGRRLAQSQLFKRRGVDMVDIHCGEDYVKPLMKFFRTRERRR
jgi:uncharacterized protein (DUF58 family)